MTDRFSISIEEWLGNGSGDRAERETNAEIAISVGENCVTQVEDFESKTVRSTIRVSAVPLAKWILANWWRLKCEAEPIFADERLDWSMSHSMAAIGGGYVWPDFVFSGSDGSQISVICKRHLSGATESFSPIRFLNSFQATISVSDFEHAARRFIEMVLARLANVGIRKSDLHDLWKDLSAEWANPKLTSYRKLEALLGLEPDQEDALVTSVLKWGKQFGQGAGEEISAASGSHEIARILAEAKALAAGFRTFADLPYFAGMGSQNGTAPPANAAPWQRAQSLAYGLREQWNLGDSPIRDEDLAERLSLPVAKLRDTKTEAPFSFGLKGHAEGKVGFLLNRQHDHGRRFDIARLIGDYLSYDQEGRLLPATRAMTARQKFQRAFAAEFLCPSRMVEDRSPMTLDPLSIGKVIDEISREYNVAELVVAHHMQNRRGFSKELLVSSLLLA